ncbi:MAG: amidohydrolase, partial [Bacillota bacterium]|nr:amidohydrolase [Bacillota bacterium]
MAIFIKDILYLPMTGRGELHKGSIRIEGQRITAMGDITPKWGDEIIYGQDKCALPGFVNCHTHGAMTMLRGYGEGLPLQQWLNDVIRPAEERLTGEDFYLGNLLAQLEMLKGGTTCYADMYFDPESAIWAAETSGIRAVLGAGLVDYDGHGEHYLRDAVRLFHEHENDLEGRIHFMLAPHAVYSCSEAYLKQISQTAQELHCPIHIHVAETRKEQEECLQLRGKRVIPYLEDTGILDLKVIAAHMIHLEEDEMKLAGERDLHAIHCPQSNMKLASGIFPYEKLKKHGVNIALGTDGAASNN